MFVDTEKLFDPLYFWKRSGVQTNAGRGTVVPPACQFQNLRNGAAFFPIDDLSPAASEDVGSLFLSQLALFAPGLEVRARHLIASLNLFLLAPGILWPVSEVNYRGFVKEVNKFLEMVFRGGILAKEKSEKARICPLASSI
ncbi:hypothetical protein [Kiloniella sp. b19]|uniref:hypothetical protein n=1 Tax=Kiloniella sp. GXU_MW_B19 TaxID=3141326 RepID=UPI0031CF559B